MSQTNPPDTQWPRWEVFKQDNAKKVHQAVGSVHAVDSEHALPTARSVFARRPNAISMWVVNENDIYSVTKEELKALPTETVEQTENETYLVFTKTTNRRSMVFVNHVGNVSASNARSALEEARHSFNHDEVLTWWLIAERNITKSDTSNESIESWFAPAKEKTYKQQSNYGQIGSHPSSKKRNHEPRN